MKSLSVFIFPHVFRQGTLFRRRLVKSSYFLINAFRIRVIVGACKRHLLCSVSPSLHDATENCFPLPRAFAKN
jgi:hypothetical protein